MDNQANLTEYRSITSELKNIAQNHEEVKKQITEIETIIEDLKKSSKSFEEQRKKAETRLEELTTIVSKEVDGYAEQYENITKRNDELELRGFSNDDEQKELLQAFGEEAALFDLLASYSGELGIEHGYQKKQRSITYKPKAVETLQAPPDSV